MALTVKDSYGGKTGPEKLPGPKDRYTHTWTVISTGATTGQSVLSKIGVTLGSTNPDYPGCVCTQVSPEQDPDAEKVWRVRATYDSALSNWPLNELEPETIPTLRAPVVTLSTERAEMYLPHDSDEKPFVNVPFKKPFDPFPIPYMHLRIDVTKNFASITIDDLKLYVPSVNSAQYQVGDLGVIEKGEGLLDSVSATPMREYGIWYWRVSCSILVNPLKWIPFKVLNVSDVYVNDNGVVTLPKDDQGVTFMDKYPITVQGKRAGVGTYHWLEFRLFRWRNFGALQLFD
ncbi:MAG: hypothetical protein HQ581_27595 [Planctomycetes bacterium]|nr:hypothetical protein [Planctomycetota bacterium]